MKVTEIMKRHPCTCMYLDTAQHAAMLMKQHDIGFLPVVNEGQRLLGVVTDRDLCLKATAEGRLPAHMRVHECMTVNPVCCLETDSVRTVLALMARNQIRRIPIIDEQKRVLGLVSVCDFIRHGAVTGRDIYLVLRRITAPKYRESRQRVVPAA